MPNGRGLVAALARGATARSLWRVPLNGGTMERIPAAGTSVTMPAWSVENGALVFVQRRSDVNLWRIRADGSGTQAMVAGSSVLDSSPAFSPDGTRIAFRSDRTGTNEIWVTGLLQNSPRRLTRMNGPVTGSPSWSPDGKWVAYDSRGGGNSDILLEPATGG